MAHAIPLVSGPAGRIVTQFQELQANKPPVIAIGSSLYDDNLSLRQLCAQFPQKLMLDAHLAGPPDHIADSIGNLGTKAPSMLYVSIEASVGQHGIAAARNETAMLHRELLSGEEGTVIALMDLSSIFGARTQWGVGEEVIREAFAWGTGGGAPVCGFICERVQEFTLLASWRKPLERPVPIFLRTRSLANIDYVGGPAGEHDASIWPHQDRLYEPNPKRCELSSEEVAALIRPEAAA